MADLEGAHSTEFDRQTPHPVIALITEWRDEQGRIETRSRATIWAAPCGSAPRTAGWSPAVWRARSMVRQVRERHRHRYEFNNAISTP
jgi:CTP synthase